EDVAGSLRWFWIGSFTVVLLIVGLVLAGLGGLSEAPGAKLSLDRRGWLIVALAVIGLVIVVLVGMLRALHSLYRGVYRQAEMTAELERLRADAEAVRRLREQRHDFRNQLT